MTKYIIETDDAKDAKHMIDGPAMKSVIETAWCTVFRPTKHQDLTDCQATIVEELSQRFLDHFDEFLKE